MNNSGTVHPASKHWIAVACAQHVRIGRAAGFMQVCHGKQAPLRRIKPGDHVVYYSPTQMLGVSDGYQSFTAIGVVRAGDPYQVEMYPDFLPYRRDVDWFNAQETAIKPLLNQMAFSAGNPRWAYPFRFGLLEISADDMQVIARAMQVQSLAA